MKSQPSDLESMEVELTAVMSAQRVKRKLVRQIRKAMATRRMTQSELARRMDTSRAVVNRLLDPGNTALTLTTLATAATVLHRHVKVELR